MNSTEPLLLAAAISFSRRAIVSAALLALRAPMMTLAPRSVRTLLIDR